MHGSNFCLQAGEECAVRECRPKNAIFKARCVSSGDFNEMIDLQAASCRSVPQTENLYRPNSLAGARHELPFAFYFCFGNSF